MVQPKFEWALKRGQWKEQSGRCALQLIQDADSFIAGIEAYRYARKDTIVDVGIPTMTSYEEKYLESHWTSAITHYSIKPDFRFFKLAAEWSSRNEVDPNSVFLGTWKIDPESNYHDHLLGRVRETMTFGSFKPFQWLAMFARIGLKDSIEIRSIAGLIVKSNGMPYKIKKGDNSVITDVSLFYNIQNLIETLLNIANLRCSLNLRVLTLFTSSESPDRVTCFEQHEIHLDSLLDELALTYAVAPKQVCKAVRGFFTLVIRTAGALATKQRTFVHQNVNLNTTNRAGSMNVVDFDARELLLPFFMTEVMLEEYLKGLNMLTDLRMHKIRVAIEIYMRVSLCMTDPDHFITFGSFLHSIMALAGYGRALPYASAPEQGDERADDPHQISDAIEEQILNLNTQALAAGYSPPVDEKWIPTCISYWKSTSAGVAPVQVQLKVDGKERQVKLR